MKLQTWGMLFFLLFAFSVHSVNVTFNDDFVFVDQGSSVIAEVSKRATAGTDWQFELQNKGYETVFVIVRQNGVDLIPDLISKNTHRRKSGFLVLEKGQSVRLAGLHNLQLLTLIVLTEDEIKDIPDNPNDTPMQKDIRDSKRKAIVNFARSQGRIRTDLKALEGKTLFFSYELGRVAPVKKTLFKRYTDSGLSLDRNMVEDPS